MQTHKASSQRCFTVGKRPVGPRCFSCDQSPLQGEKINHVAQQKVEQAVDGEAGDVGIDITLIYPSPILLAPLK